MSFNYISQINISDCYTYSNFDIPTKKLEEFRHIIITGNNASGKTTILNRVALSLFLEQNNISKIQRITDLQSSIKRTPNSRSIEKWKMELKDLIDINLSRLNDNFIDFSKSDDSIFSFFKAHRKVVLRDVNTVSKESFFTKDLITKKNSDEFIGYFKQYLVNKKVYEAFDFMKTRGKHTNQNQIFFENLTGILRNVLNDKKLTLEFNQEIFEFYLVLGDSRRITFNQLSEGFSAFMNILMDLLMRVDLIRKAKQDYSYEPCGIVIIDEPETHLHLNLQYEILPLINNLFPKIQLIIATHSPAIISSLLNSIVYDITSKKELESIVIGSSYSELMIKHFGLDNEFSSTADKIIIDIRNAVKSKNVKKLQSLLEENDKYLTPFLRLEIESQIVDLKNK